MTSSGEAPVVMEMPRTEPEHELVVNETLEAYRQAWMALRQYGEPVWTQLDLTLSQVKALLLLDVRGSMTIGKLASVMEIGRPSASILIEQLVQLRLVVRTEDLADRRRTLVCLSEEGYYLVERLMHGDQAFIRTWLERLRDRDLVALNQGLRALAAAAKLPADADDDSSDTGDIAG